MEEYVIYVDETIPNQTNPFFCFAGAAFMRKDYEDIVIPKVNSLKNKYFQTTDIVFHFYEMKKSTGQFKIFTDQSTRESFWKDYVTLITELPMSVLGVYFDSRIMSACFPYSKYDNYELGFSSLVDNIMHFLVNNDGCGQIIVESRTFKENSNLHTTFLDYRNRGSLFYKEGDIRKHISALGFITKKENCIGLQIADMLPSELLRYCRTTKGFYGLTRAISGKIYGAGTDTEKIVGFKNII
jgi:hypothetical protein